MISLVNRDALRDVREEACKVVNTNPDQHSIREARRIIEELNRTFVVPFVQLDMLNRSLEPSDLPQEDQRVLISGKNARQSMWFTIAAEAISAYNTMLHCLYRVFPKENFLSFLMEPISLNYTGAGETVFPDCLSNWEASVRIGRAQRISNFSFRMDSPDVSLELKTTGKLTSAEFNGDSLADFRRVLKPIDPLNPEWPLEWQYLFFAERYRREGNLRVAVIDLDLAGSIMARKWLKTRTTFPEDAFDRVSQKSSTGDFLYAASFVCCNQRELSCFEDLRALHNLRNTILHRYQRSLGEQHREIFTKAKDAIIFLSSANKGIT